MTTSLQNQIRYSPNPPASYPGARSGLIKGDDDAWNLAWLSHPFADGFHPDPNFTTLVRRSLQLVIVSGQIDLIDARPPSAKVRGLMRRPPAQAVRIILEMEHLVSIPLFVAYGTAWTDTIKERCRLYREPEHFLLDKPVTDLTQALAIIDHCR